MNGDSGKENVLGETTRDPFIFLAFINTTLDPLKKYTFLVVFAELFGRQPRARVAAAAAAGAHNYLIL